MLSNRLPKIVVESDAAAQRFYVLAEWSRRDRSILAVRAHRDEALNDAGRAAVAWQSGPVVERETPHV